MASVTNTVSAPRVVTLNRADSYWNVGTETSSDRPGVVVLKVFKVYHDMRNEWGGKGRIVHAECYGMEFPAADDAYAYALERGFLEPYYRRVWCSKHRALHTFLGKPSPTFGECHND